MLVRLVPRNEFAGELSALVPEYDSLFGGFIGNEPVKPVLAASGSPSFRLLPGFGMDVGEAVLVGENESPLWEGFLAGAVDGWMPLVLATDSLPWNS